MLSESDKSADHEICSSDHGRFHCVRFTNVRSVTTALSGESRAAIWHRSDRDRKGFDPTFCTTSACYSAKVSTVSAATRRRSPARQEDSHSCSAKWIIAIKTGCGLEGNQATSLSKRRTRVALPMFEVLLVFLHLDHVACLS